MVNPLNDSSSHLVNMSTHISKLPNEAAILAAENVPTLVTPKRAEEDMEASKKIDWKKVALRTLSFFSAAALGVLTGLAIAGVMATPIGWGLAGGALAICLIGSLKYGGPKEFFENLKYSLLGFGVGIGSGMIGGGFAVGAATNATLASTSGTHVIAGSFTAAPFAALTMVKVMAEALNEPLPQPL